MTDINELMSRNPLELTEPDMDQLVTYLRERRVQFTLGNLKAGSAKKPTEKQQKILDQAKDLGISFEDLDI